MRLGIFSKLVERPSLAACLDGVRQAGLSAVQFNFESAGLGHMPERIGAELCAQIRAELAARDIELAALSGTFNIIHPDTGQRRSGMARLQTLAAAAKELGTEVITFCTGTCNPDSLWRPHPDNGTAQTWRKMLAAMEEAVAIAAGHGVVLAFEPEVNNVVDSAAKARRLLDEIASPHLQVVIDGANLFHAGQLGRMDEILDEAFQLLGDSIRLAHAKDLDRDGDAGDRPAGAGVLDYERYLRLLQGCGYGGPIILHSLAEADVPAAAEHVRGRWPV